MTIKWLVNTVYKPVRESMTPVVGAWVCSRSRQRPVGHLDTHLTNLDRVEVMHTGMWCSASRGKG